MREGWTYKKLGEIAYIGLGFTHTPQYVENGIPFLSVKDISNGYISLDDVKYISYEEYLSAPKGAKPNKGDIMFCRVGTMGKPVIVDLDIPFCTFVSLGYLHLQNKNMNVAYVKYWMTSNSFFSQVEANVNGGTIKNLNTSWLKNFIVPIPSLSEQERIVSELDLLSGIIEKQKEQLKAYDQLAQSIFYDMFGSTNDEKGWNVKKFGEVGTFQRGGGFLKSDFVEEGFPCIHYGQIHTKFGFFTYTNLTSISKELAMSKSRIAHKGDIIIAITSEDVEGSCKSVAWMGDYDVAVGAHAAIFSHNQNPIYVSFYFRSAEYNRAKERYARGFKVVEIKPDDIAKIEIPLPPLSLQQSFAEKIEAIEKQKELIKQSITETETLFNSRMDYYFN